MLDVIVTDDGRVRYALLRDNSSQVRNALNRYVAQIGRISPESRPDLFRSPADRLAYYLNAYNALALQAVFQRDLPDNVLLSGTYTTPMAVGGRFKTLEALENDHVRTAGDPRVHFALNTMTRSAPPLAKDAYAGAELDDQLDAQARRFLSDPRAVHPGPDARTVRLSELFTRFYPNDFKDAFARETGADDPDLLDSIRPFADADSPLLTAERYETMPFDWSINRAD